MDGGQSIEYPSVLNWVVFLPEEIDYTASSEGRKEGRKEEEEEEEEERRRRKKKKKDLNKKINVLSFKFLSFNSSSSMLYRC